MPSNLCKSTTLALLIGLAAAACSTVTPAGLIAASSLDPLTSNARDISVAVGVPEALRLSSGDVQFHISFVSETETVSETVPLRVERGAAETLSGTHDALYIARFSESDAARITAAQARIRALKAAGQDGKGTLTVAVVGGCVTQGPLATIPVSTWLQTDPTRDFVQLTREIDMLTALPPDDAETLTENMMPCA